MQTFQPARTRLLALLLLLAAGCAGTRASAPAHVVPFDRHGSLIVVPARVNGAGPYQFLVDTGAPHSLLSPRAAQAPDVKRGAPIRIFGVGPTTHQSTRLAEVTLGLADHLMLPLQWVDESPEALFDPASRALGTRLDGILGYELFRRYVVEIDYEKQTLKLYEPKDYRYHGPGRALPLVAGNGTASVAAKVTARAGDAPLDCRLTLDTGAGLEVQLRKPLLTRRAVDQRVRTLPGRATGAGGESLDRFGRLAQLHLGPFALKNVLTSFSRGDEQILGDGLLGGDALRRFRVVIDYEHAQLILEPGPHVADASPADQSGMGLRAEGETLRDYRVASVTENTPAAEAGVRVGDIVLSVDGRPAGDWRLQDLREHFRQDGTRRLTLRRGEQTVECTVKLRPLL